MIMKEVLLYLRCVFEAFGFFFPLISFLRAVEPPVLIQDTVHGGSRRCLLANREPHMPFYIKSQNTQRVRSKTHRYKTGKNPGGLCSALKQRHVFSSAAQRENILRRTWVKRAPTHEAESVGSTSTSASRVNVLRACYPPHLLQGNT